MEMVVTRLGPSLADMFKVLIESTVQDQVDAGYLASINDRGGIHANSHKA